MNCYICIDEYRIIWGIFESKEEAQLYASIINDNPKCDTIIKVRDWSIMPKGLYTKEFLKNLAEKMIEEDNNKEL